MKELERGQSCHVEGVGGKSGQLQRLRPITPLNKSYRVLFFPLQRENADDSSFGNSSLEVHLARVIMTVTDGIKVTLTDGGWRHLFRSLNASSSLISAVTV